MGPPTCAKFTLEGEVLLCVTLMLVGLVSAEEPKRDNLGSGAKQEMVAKPAPPKLSDMLGIHKAGDSSKDGVYGTLELNLTSPVSVSVTLSTNYQHAASDSLYSCHLEAAGRWKVHGEVLATGFQNDDCRWSLVYADGQFFPKADETHQDACAEMCGGMGQITIDSVRFSLRKSR